MTRRDEAFKDAINLLDRGECDRAIKIFKQTVQNEPNGLDAKFNLALCYMIKIGIDLQEEEPYILKDLIDEEVYAIRALPLLKAILKERVEDEEVKEKIEGTKK